ncbi:StAR related lipid transfer domain containing 10, partial [Homo sapiens]
MEKLAASTEPQGPRPVLGRESVQVPDDQDFRSFRSECEAEVGWNLTYSRAGVSVWVQAVEMDRTLHKIKPPAGTQDCGWQILKAGLQYPCLAQSQATGQAWGLGPWERISPRGPDGAGAREDSGLRASIAA